jgi:hypothetical protein
MALRDSSDCIEREHLDIAMAPDTDIPPVDDEPHKPAKKKTYEATQLPSDFHVTEMSGWFKTQGFCF